LNFKIKKPCSFKKILLLDDEPYNIEVLMSIFKSLKLRGFPNSIDCCYNGDDALKNLKQSIFEDPETGDKESDYCLILSDLNMPIMDGYEFAEKAKDLLI